MAVSGMRRSGTVIDTEAEIVIGVCEGVNVRDDLDRSRSQKYEVRSTKSKVRTERNCVDVALSSQLSALSSQRVCGLKADG